MADFEKAIPITLQWEGGYVNNPSDPGGETNRGITIVVWRQYAHLCGCQGTSDELKALTVDQAKTMYKQVFWNLVRGDEINDQALANQIFDTTVNCGTEGILIIQGILHAHELQIVADGVMGPKTIAAINAYPADVLASEYKAARIAYYNYLPSRNPKLSVFLNGWLRRANSF